MGKRSTTQAPKRDRKPGAEPQGRMINQIKYGKGLWVGVTVMGSVGVGRLNVEVSRRTGNKCTSTHVTKSGQVSLLVSAVTIHLCIYVLIENYKHHTEYKIGIAADTRLQDVCSKYYSVLNNMGKLFPTNNPKCYLLGLFV